MKEVTQAITKLNNRKSVGRDQISSEIIEANKGWIMPIIRQLYNNCDRNNERPKILDWWNNYIPTQEGRRRKP